MNNGEKSHVDLIRRRTQEQSEAEHPLQLPVGEDEPAKGRYTDLIRKRASEDRLRVQAAVALGAARDPEREARVEKVRRSMRGTVPDTLIRNNLDRFESDLKGSGVNVSQVMEHSPKLARFLGDNAGIAVDDVANLSGLEWVFKSWIGALDYGWQQSVYGARAFAQMNKIPGIAGEGNEQRLDDLEQHVLRRYFGDESFIESAWVEFWKFVPMMVSGAAIGAGTAAIAGQLGPQAALPEEAVTIPGAAIKGAFAYTYILEAGFAYRELKEMTSKEGQPLDPRLVYGLSSSVGAVNGAMELLGLGKALKVFPGGKQMMARMGLLKIKEALAERTFRKALTSFAKDYGEALLWEPGTEMAQEITPILARVIAKKIEGGTWDNENIEQNAREVWDVGLKTFAAMSLGGAFMSGPKLGIDTRLARRTARNVARLESMAGQAKKSKLRVRLPEAFRDYVKELTKTRGAAKHVYVPVEQWNEILKNSELDPSEEADNLVGPGQYDQLMRDGGQGDLVIPIEMYLEKVAATGMHDKLLDHMRLYQGDLTHNELKQERDGLKELLDQTTGPIAVLDLDPAEREIYDQEYGEVLRVTNDSVYADTVAKIKARTINRLAKRAGIDPVKHYKRYEFGLYGPMERVERGETIGRVTPSGEAIHGGEAYRTNTALQGLVEGVRTGDEKAIEQAAQEMAGKIRPGETLVPVPDAFGNTGSNRKLAEAIARITGAQLQDVLTSTPRVSQKERRARGVTSARAQDIETTVREMLTPEEKEQARGAMPVNPRVEMDKLAYWISRNGGISPKEEGVWKENYKKIPGLANKDGDTFDGLAETLIQHWPEHFEDRHEAFEWLRDEWQFGERQKSRTKVGVDEAAIAEMDIRGAVKQVEGLVEEATQLGVQTSVQDLANAIIEDKGWKAIDGDKIKPGEVYLVRDTGELHQATLNEQNEMVLADGTDLPINDFTFYDVVPLGPAAGPAPKSSKVPAVQNAVLIDTVRVTGATVASAQKALPGSRYVVLAAPDIDKGGTPQAPEVGAAAATNEFVRWYQRGFHGGPFRFDEFDISKVGTGEGAAAYGWGLYFTSHQEIADWYYRNLVRSVHGEEALLVDRPTYIPRIDQVVWSEIGAGDWQQVSAWRGAANEDYRSALFDLQGRFHWYDTDKISAGEVNAKIRKELQKTVKAQSAELTALESEPSRREVAGKIAKVLKDAEIDVSAMIDGHIAESGDWSNERMVMAESVRYAHGLLGLTTREHQVERMPGWLTDEQIQQLQEQVPAEMAREFEKASKRDQRFKEAERTRRQAAVALEIMDDPHFNMRVDLVEPKGQVLSAEIPDPDDLLNWDTPIGDQDAWNILAEHEVAGDRDELGREMYERIGRELTYRKPPAALARFRQEHGPITDQQEAASKFLESIGIPGHSYIGGTSGETNFVLYSDDRISDVTRLYQAEAVEGRGVNTPQFRAWFGDSVVRTEDGHPLVVYHGTTHTFTKFSRERGSFENQFGKNFYFTDGHEDVAINYAGFGPDLTSQIERRAEWLAMDDEPGMRQRSDRHREQARKEIAGEHEGAVLPVFLSLQNPANLDTGRFTYEYSGEQVFQQFRGEALERIAEDEGVEVGELGDASEESLRDAALDLASEAGIEAEYRGSGHDFLMALDRAAMQFDDVDDAMSPSQAVLEEFNGDLDGVSMGEVEEYLRKGSKTRGEQAGGESPIVHATDPETGNLSSGEIIAQAFKGAGFDGIVHSAERFLAGPDRGGMEGVTGATHYIMFEPTQIKSATGNKGTFDAADPDLRAQGKKGFIEFKPGGRTFDIHLLETADPSTLFHETAHFFLEMMGDMAYTQGAKDAIIDDYENVLKFLGVRSRDELKELHHEKFARAYEQYLREGKSPSEELRGVFSKIKAWMMSVYGQVKDLVTLTPEIKGVFDRMIASDEEIAQARATLKLQPIEAIRESMTDAERSQYDRIAREAQQQGEDELRAQLMADAGEVREWWKEREGALRTEIEDEFRKTAGMQALHVLQKGAYIGGGDLSSAVLSDEPVARPLKLDAEILVERYGPEILKQLPGWKGQYVYTRNDKKRPNPRAADPDDLAPLMGFEDGTALVEFLKGAQGYDESFKEAMSRRMDARHGDLLEDRSRLVKAAVEAAQSEAQVEQLLVEVRYLRRQLRSDVAENRRRPLDHGYMKLQAESQVAQKRLVELSPHVYQRNAQKHGTAAFNAAEAGNIAKAYDEKVRQLWNMAVYRAARDAKRESDVSLRYFRNMLKTPSQRRLGLAGSDFRNMVNQLLEKFDLKTKSRSEIVGQRSATEFLQAREEQDQDPVIDEALASSPDKHYLELTVDEMRRLRDSIKSIDHLAKEAYKARDATEKAEYNANKHAMLSSLDVNVPDRGKYDPLSDMEGGWKNTLGEWISWADSRLLRLEEVVDRMDGRDIEGPWRANIWEPMVKAQADEGDLTRQYALKLSEVYEKLPRKFRKEMLQGKVKIDSLGGRRIPLQACIALALNTGNVGNLQRVKDGGTAILDPKDPRWPEVMDEMLAMMDKEHWKFVQRLWDTIAGLWPQIEAMEERLTGIPPVKVEKLSQVREFSDGTSMTVEGGYFPIVYDDIAGVPESVVEGGTAMDVLTHPSYVRAMTAHGHVYKRYEKLGKPVRLDLGIIPRHMQQVIHDLTHREAIVNAYKLINDKTVRAAMYDSLGKERHKVFNIWLRRLAGDRMTDDPRMERFFRQARMNATVVAMAGKATVVAQNFANIFNVMEPGRGVKAKHLSRGLREFYQHPIAVTQMIHELSGEMRHRFNNLERDIRHGIEATLGEVNLTPLKKARHMAQRFGFGMIAMTDKAVAYPAWLGAYEQAKQEGKDEKHAIMHADRMVRTVLTSGAPKDIASVQGGGELNRSLTMFYSWFSGAYMRFRSLQFDMRIDRREGLNVTMAALPFYLARATAFWLVPAMFAEVLANRGWWEDDDDSVFEWALTKTLMYPALTIPAMRDVAGFFESRKKGYQRSIKYVPLGRILEEGAKATAVMIEEAGDLLFDPGEFEVDKAGKSATRLMGHVFGLPSSQFEITFGYLWDVMIEDQKPEDIVEFLQHLLFYRKPEERE